jgi:hypothetical protein
MDNPLMDQNADWSQVGQPKAENISEGWGEAQ